MDKTISFSCFNRIYDIKQQWIELDGKAESTDCRYIEYTYYQTYEWNEFLYRCLTGGLHAATTSMRYHLVKLDGKPFAIIPTVVTRMSGKVRLPSCRVAGVLNMACPYASECSDELLSSIAEYMKDSHKGMKLSLADVPQTAPLARVMGRICTNVKERTSFHVALSRFSSHDEYLSSLPKNIYKNIRKAYNHLKTDGKTMALRRFDRDNMPGRRIYATAVETVFHAQDRVETQAGWCADKMDERREVDSGNILRMCKPEPERTQGG